MSFSIKVLLPRLFSVLFSPRCLSVQRVYTVVDWALRDHTISWSERSDAVETRRIKKVMDVQKRDFSTESEA
jgi:hypothetical protein